MITELIVAVALAVSQVLATHVSGTATWLCNNDPRWQISGCTRGYGPADMVAAIDTKTGIKEGAWLRVTSGKRHVTVHVVDVCGCPGTRVIDLSIGAFRRLADPSVGVIPVTLEVVSSPRSRGSGAPAPTAPPTDV